MNFTNKCKHDLLIKTGGEISSSNLNKLKKIFCQNLGIIHQDILDDPSLYHELLEFIQEKTYIHFTGCSGKTRFDSRKQAKQFANKGKRHHGFERASPYKCENCGYFHLSRTKKEGFSKAILRPNLEE